MRCANLLAVANQTDPALARLAELHRVKARAERTYRKAFDEERAEAMRLMDLQKDGPGTIAIADTMQVTREAVRQAYNRWKGRDGCVGDGSGTTTSSSDSG